MCTYISFSYFIWRKYENIPMCIDSKTIWPTGTRCPQKGSVYYLVYMMTSSNGNIFRVTGPLCGEFTGPCEFPAQRPVTRSFGVFVDLHPNKRLSKQWWGWWFQTQSCPLWRHRIVLCRWWIWFWWQGPSFICISQVHVHAFVQQWHPDNAYLGCIMLCEWFWFTQKALHNPFWKIKYIACFETLKLQCCSSISYNCLCVKISIVIFENA